MAMSLLCKNNKIILELVLPYLSLYDRFNLSLVDSNIESCINRLHSKYKYNYGYKLIMSENPLEIFDRIFSELCLKDQVSFIKTCKIFYNAYKNDVRHNKNEAFKDAMAEIEDIVERRYRSGTGTMKRYYHYAKKEIYKLYGFRFTNFFWTDDDSYIFLNDGNDSEDDEFQFDEDFFKN